MSEVLYHFLHQRMPLDRKSFQSILSLFTERILEKGELLLREGEVPRSGNFICSGCLRSYVVDEKGKEHVVEFAPETWWLSDIPNMISRTPTPYFMDALEPSEILMIDVENFQKLLDKVPAFEKAYQAGIQKHTAAKDERIIASLTADAEARYHRFLQTFPSIARRVPQHMLASYLGISPETLSRVRKKWAMGKGVLHR